MNERDYEPLKRVSEREMPWSVWRGGARIVDYHRMYADIAEDEPRPELENVELASGFLDELIQQFDFGEGILEEDLRVLWAQSVGEFIARHTRAKSLIKGHLVVQVSEATVRANLIQTSRMILKSLQAKHGADLIRSIHFQLG